MLEEIPKELTDIDNEDAIAPASGESVTNNVSADQIDSQAADVWDVERLFVSGDEFFADLLGSIKSAKSTIQLEYYIFTDDRFAELFQDELCAAAKRGVKVQLIVDGIGSLAWIGSYEQKFVEAGVQFQVYKRLKWLEVVKSTIPFSPTPNFLKFLKYSNRRNHRKVCIVDKEKAWGGGMNVAECHLKKYEGDAAWRDTGIFVKGKGLADLVSDFEFLWEVLLSPRKFGRRKLIEYPPLVGHKLIRLNTKRVNRRRNYAELLSQISSAKERAWLTQAYFVPHISALRALKRAASNGVDVRVLVPGKSDLFFMPALAATFELTLIKHGIKVFRYSKERVLHAKTVLIDDWGMVSSTNLNHRSLFHDLEVDFVLTRRETRDELAQHFLDDLKESEEVSAESVSQGNYLARVLARLIYVFRYWM